MPAISSYALQYSNVDYPTILASTFDLFICEADADNSPFIVPNLTDSQVAALTAQGRTIVGYVNVGVTDANRAYWQDSWTSAGSHPRHEDDLNPVAASAPAWLQNRPTNAFGILVDFTDAAWQTLVINQAVALVQRGYSGVFLDDVGCYDDTISQAERDTPAGQAAIRQLATQMAVFVAAIEAAITQVNANAYVVVNSDPYLHTNVTTDAAGAQAAANYLAAVDAHLLENQSAAAITYAQSSLAGETRLILESDGSPAYSYADSWARGILYTTSSYSTLGTFAYPMTSGADTFSGGDGPNQISGLGGNDVLYGGNGNDSLDGGADNDTLTGGGGTDTLTGGTGDDAYFLDSAADAIVEFAGQGFDTAYSSASYTLAGAVSVEVLSAVDWSSTAALNFTGNELANIVYGNAGANSLSGAGGADTLSGFGGDDVYFVDVAADAVIESTGQGYDTVYAAAGYALAEGVYVEILSTVNWAATTALNLSGNSLGNTLFGNAGANVLNGGGGADALTGFGGADTFAFTTALGGGNVDTVGDFVHGTDKIALDDAIFTAITGGSLSAGAFVIGTGAGDSDDRIIYNSATGVLLYDADGNGGGAAVQFATLGTGLALTASDFQMI